MEQKIKTWILDFVSQQNTAIGFVPCPFAKQALLEKKIVFKPFHTDLRHQLYEIVNSKWDDTKEVLVLYADKDQITSDELSKLVLQFNKTCKHLDIDLVALEDHPDDIEIINGATMNFGEGILVLIQKLSKLTKASDILKRQGYYDKWSKDNLEDVVEWRKSAI